MARMFLAESDGWMDCLSLAVSPDRLFLCKCCGLSIVEAKCPCIVRSEKIYVKDTFDWFDFLDDFYWKPRLKRYLKYFTEMQAEIWVCVVCHGFSIVWTQGGPQPLSMSELNLTWNFVLILWTVLHCFTKSFVLPCLLGYRTFLIAQSATKRF